MQDLAQSSALKGTVSQDRGQDEPMEQYSLGQTNVREPFFRLKIGCFKAMVHRVAHPLMLKQDLQIRRILLWLCI
jgi:hypothetical protein